MSIPQQAIVVSQRIVIGDDADIARWDRAKKATASQARLHHGPDYRSYEGNEITGLPVATLLRVRFVVPDDELVGEKGEGRYVSRGKPGGGGSLVGWAKRSVPTITLIVQCREWLAPLARGDRFAHPMSERSDPN